MNSVKKDFFLRLGAAAAFFWILGSLDARACTAYPVLADLDQSIAIVTNVYAPILLVAAEGDAAPRIETLEDRSGKQDLAKYSYLNVVEGASRESEMMKRFGSAWGPVSKKDQARVGKRAITWIEITANELTAKELIPKFPLILNVATKKGPRTVQIELSPKTVESKGMCKFRPEIKPLVR